MKIIIDFLKLIRIANLLILAISISFFYYLILVPAHHYKLYTTLLPFTQFEFVLFVLSVILLAAAGNIINDYFDFQLDKEFKPTRPLAKGTFSLNTALYIHAVLVFAGVGLGFFLGYRVENLQVGYIYIICALLLYLYSAYLKKTPLAGNIVIAALVGFVFLLLLLFEVTFLNTISFDEAPYVLNILLWQVKFYGGFAFLINFAREVVKDIEDREGDETYDVHTFVVQYGETAGKILAILILYILLAGIVFFIRGFIQAGAIKEFIYMIVAVVAPVLLSIFWLFKARAQKDYARISLLLKFIMLLGIFSIPAFYLFNRIAA